MIIFSIVNPQIEITVDAQDYMTNGPGRFASPAFFDIIQLFFSSTSTRLVKGSYTEKQLAAILGIDQKTKGFISQQQWAYADNKNDYAERVYIWNSIAAEISDEAVFVIGTNGERSIANFSIIPFSNDGTDNFDFSSSDGLAKVGNIILEPIIDPSGIGRKVVINFSDNLVRKPKYTYADYQADAARAVLPNPLLLTSLPEAILALTDQLFANGPTQALYQGKPILYGTNGADILKGGTSVTGVSIGAHRNLGQYLLAGNGIVYVTGAGNDTITGTGQADILIAGEGADILDGGTGADTLTGGLGDDTFIIDNPLDKVIEKSGQGKDRVISSLTSTSLFAFTEELILTGNAISGTGNSDNNFIQGNAQNNTLTGNAGADTLIGNKGNDSLLGGADNDVYQFNVGDGQDIITETGGANDTLQLTGINANQLWLKHVGNNLEISQIGGTDKVTIKDWYKPITNSSATNNTHIETFKSGDNKVLIETQVDNLVSAMASFAPPSAGITTLPNNYQAVLNPIIAASWK